jgi:hypothetical protein
MLAWFAGLVGIAALGRWLARRTHPVEAPAEPSPPEEPLQQAEPAGASAEEAVADPAAELRRTLAAAREAHPDPPASTDPAEETLDERRARVHGQARQVIDEMADREPAG